MANNDLPPSTPLDVRQGVTDAQDTAHPLRWGILGCGNISAQWVWCLQQVPGATITAAAARDKDRAQAFADRHGIPTAYDRYTDMVAASDVDIVYIGTITRLHKEHTLLAIEAGKHGSAKNRSLATRPTPPRCTPRPTPGGSCCRTPCGRASSRPSSTPGSPLRRV